MPIWTEIYAFAFWPLLALVSAACWRWGAPVHRRAALIIVVAMLAGLIALSPRGWAHLETAAALVDLALFVALTVLATHRPRWWLLAMAAVQLLVVAGHLAKLLHPHMSRLTYALLTGNGGYVQLTLLSIGLLLAGRTRRSSAVRRA